MVETVEQIKCLNCDNGLYQKDHYCNHCGQKNKQSLITVRQLIADFILNFFNLDSRLLKAVTKIWKPAQLTIEYIQGKRKTHVNPARMFLLTMVIHLTVLLYIQNHYGVDGISEVSDSLVIAQQKSEMLSEFDSLRQKYQVEDNAAVDSIQKYLFDGVRAKGTDTIAIDLPFQIFEKYPILLNDVTELSDNEILEKYNVEGYSDRLLIRQGVRIAKDVKGTLNFFIGNLVWVVILSILFMVFIMKILYIRGHFYLIEHLVFQFHIHTFFFLLLSIGFILDAWLGNMSDVPQYVLITFTICCIYYLIGMKRYYKQGWIKTIIKFFILNIFYLIVITVCLTNVALLSVFLF